MKRNNFKNFCAGIFIPIIFFLFLEIFFTVFLIFYMTEYHPLIKYFFNNDTSNNIAITNIEKKTIKLNKYTGNMVPGIYEINNFKVRVNNKGFRGEDFTNKNKKGCRIITFGGSTTLGLQSKKPYPQFLEEKLIKNNFDCEVLNFGLGGRSLNYIENLLVNEVVNYSPNIITIMSNANATRYDSYGNSSIISNIIESKFQLYVYKINKFCFNNIMTYRFFELAPRRILSWFIDTEEKIPSPFWTSNHLKKYFTQKYLNQMINIVNFTKSKNIQLVLIKQAWFIDLKFQRELKNLSKTQLIEKLVNYQKDNYPKKLDLFLMLTNEILNRILEEVKLSNPEVVIVDPIAKLYNAKKEVNFFKDDGVHLTDNCNNIIANEIFNKIKNEI